MTQKDRICLRILHAAKDRFSHYGYCKTTMSEIAQDCNMSPGNLYRYFQGKLDIAEGIAAAHTDKRLKIAREIVRDPAKPALIRLRDFLFDELRSTFKLLDEDPRVFEIAEIIAKERPEFGNQQLAKERSLMSEILAAGAANGEFDIQDVVETAEMIQSATVKFRFPQLYSQLTLNKLEHELDGVLKILFNGLTCRSHPVTTATEFPVSPSL